MSELYTNIYHRRGEKAKLEALTHILRMDSVSEVIRTLVDEKYEQLKKERK